MYLPRSITPVASLLLVLLLLAVAPLRPLQAEAGPVGREAVEAAVPALEAYIQDFMEKAGIPGVAVGIVAGDRLVYARGFGVRRKGGTDPVDPRTLFQIGSITKSFAAGTEAVLVDRGLIDWNDRVIDHVPEFRLWDPWVTREFRVVDLLAQRSGLPPYALTGMVEFGYSRDAMIAALRHVEPITSFRSTFAYQNALHLVAERLVMSASGAPSWEAFLREAILQPLGMNATGTTAEQIEANPNHASGHSLASGEVLPIAFYPPFYNAGAAGNINSNVEDMAKWLALQINRGRHDGRELIGEAALTHTWLPQVTISPRAAYASGLVVSFDDSGRVVWHNGGTDGFASFMGFDPERQVGIVVLTNLSLSGAADAIGNRFLDMVRGRPDTDHAAALLARLEEEAAAEKEALEKNRPADPRPARTMIQYVGTYENPIYGRATVAQAGPSELTLTFGPGPTRVRLVPWSGDSFTAHLTDHIERGFPDPMGFVLFEPNPLDRIRAFSLDLSPGEEDSPDTPRFVRLGD